MYTTKINAGTRGGVAAMVVAAHVAVIYAVAVSLGVIETPPIMEPLKAVMIETPPPEPEKYVPPETPPVAAPPTMEVPLPEVPVIAPPVETAVTIPPPSETSPAPSPAPAVGETKSLQVTRRIEPVYPPASRRMDEHGTVTLRIYVDERGRPREVEVAKSSGFARLDEAAVIAVKRWVFAPAMKDSQAVATWTRVNVVFELKQQ